MALLDGRTREAKCVDAAAIPSSSGHQAPGRKSFPFFPFTSVRTVRADYVRRKLPGCSGACMHARVSVDAKPASVDSAISGQGSRLQEHRNIIARHYITTNEYRIY